MSWTKTGALCLAAALTAASASGAILQYEPFDYDNDGQGAVMVGRAGGAGFEGAWLDGDADFEIYTSGSLSYPAGSPGAGSETGGRLFAQFPGNDGAAVGSGAQEGVRDIHDSDADDVIGWNRDAVTYMSALVRKSTTGESEFEDLTIALDNGGTAIGAQFGINSDDNFFVGISTTAPVAGSKSAQAGTTYLLVAKFEAISTSGELDTLSLWVYEDGDVVPLSDPGGGAEIAQSVSSGRSLERLRLLYGNFNTGAEFDEIRIGADWSDVTGPNVPEPSGFALALAGAAAWFGVANGAMRKAGRGRA